jgi:hypothetical protein
MLEGHRRHREAFIILECILGGNSPLQFQIFRPPASGYWLNVSKLVHSWAKHGKSLPCQENIAAAWCPEGVGNFQFRQRDQPLLSPKSCVQEFQGKVLQKHIFQIDGDAIGG